MIRSLLLAAALVPLTAAGCASSTPAATSDAVPEAESDAPVTVTMPAPVPMSEGTTPDGHVAAGHGLGATERLGLSETVQPYGQPVTFVGIAEDSRCPEGTSCVWGGRVKANVQLGDETVTLTVPYGTPRDGETAVATAGSTEVELVNVHPYPGSAAARAGEPVQIEIAIRETAE